MLRWSAVKDVYLFVSKIPTYGLAPDESSGVVLFNKDLQFGPDAQVGANPLHMARVTMARPRDMQIILTKLIQAFFSSFSRLLALIHIILIVFM